MRSLTLSLVWVLGACEPAVLEALGDPTVGAPDAGCVNACAAAGSGNSAPVCGNGVRERGEQCDDGGTVSGDGCTGTEQGVVPCQLEDGFFCPQPGQACLELRCGDGVRTPDEECDDGQSPPLNGDGCSSTCRLEPGFRRTDTTWYRASASPDTLWWQQRLSAVRWERVSVPAGDFDALRIERFINFRHWDGWREHPWRTDTVWYAPTVGRWVQREWTGRYRWPGRRPVEASEDWVRWRLLEWQPGASRISAPSR